MPTMSKIVDIDWQFGVTAASSDKSLVGKTFLHVKLMIDDGEQLKQVNMEMNVPQFYKLLHELETAKTSIDYS